jgi:hypothetical protein
MQADSGLDRKKGIYPALGLETLKARRADYLDATASEPSAPSVQPEAALEFPLQMHGAISL